MKRLIHTLLTAFLVFGICFTSLAQDNTDNADISGVARVVADISVSGQRTLDFGDITDDTNVSVGITDGTSGLFHVDGSDGASVNLDFTLPEELNGDENSDTIDLSFGSGDAGYNNDQSDPNNASTFDPGSDTPDVTIDNSDGDEILGVWIGGEAQPDGTEIPGNYSATITLTATYN